MPDNNIDESILSDELLCVSRPNTVNEIDEISYLEANLDVKNSRINACEHFMKFGQAEGRLQAINRAEIAQMREWKFERMGFKEEYLYERKIGKAANFLSKKMIAEFGFPESSPVSAHPYGPPIIQIIHDNREKMFLDVGAGLRHLYFRNVVNTEIYEFVSTDVICVGESLPFLDNQFDFVFCFATLEHTKRPWDVASEICRVLKPGGTVIIDYPFLQPVHGYPHHYFNATPMGNLSLFEQYCDIQTVDIGWHHHPIVAMQWALTTFKGGLPMLDAYTFGNLKIKDIINCPLDELIEKSYCRKLDMETRRIIASGSLLIGVKK